MTMHAWMDMCRYGCWLKTKIKAGEKVINCALEAKHIFFLYLEAVSQIEV